MKKKIIQEAKTVEQVKPEDQKILVKEFIQGLVIGFLAGALAVWFVLG